MREGRGGGKPKSGQQQKSRQLERSADLIIFSFSGHSSRGLAGFILSDGKNRVEHFFKQQEHFSLNFLSYVSGYENQLFNKIFFLGH